MRKAGGREGGLPAWPSACSLSRRTWLWGRRRGLVARSSLWCQVRVARHLATELLRWAVIGVGHETAVIRTL
jgi:hypothetical protein